MSSGFYPVIWFLVRLPGTQRPQGWRDSLYFMFSLLSERVARGARVAYWVPGRAGGLVAGQGAALEGSAFGKSWRRRLPLKSGKCKVVSGKWRVVNGKWKKESGTW